MQELKLILCLLLGFLESQAQSNLGDHGLSKPTQGQIEQASQQVTKIIQPHLKTYPGISIAVGIGNEIVWSEGFGFADVRSSKQVTSQHQFRYYSLSKSITGLALAKLSDEGKLDIDQNIKSYLPDLSAIYDEVKVRHLINHTSGIRHYNKGEWLKISADHCESTSSALLPFIEDDLESVPGENHNYSSFGYVLLSHLISVIARQPYVDYVQNEILEPAGIQNIALDQSPSLNQEVSYYTNWNEKKHKAKKAIDVNNSCKFGGGGLVGTADSFAKLYLDLLNNRILPPESTARFLSEIPTDKGESTQYAFGIGDVTNANGIRYHGHTGSAVGARSIFLLYPDKKLVVVLLCNLNDPAINQEIGNISNVFRAMFDE